MPLPDLSQTLDALPFVGLAVWKTPDGYAASVEFQDGHWSPDAFGATPSLAIAAALLPLPPPPY